MVVSAARTPAPYTTVTAHRSPRRAASTAADPNTAAYETHFSASRIDAPGSAERLASFGAGWPKGSRQRDQISAAPGERTLSQDIGIGTAWSRL